jgi:phage shock protein PspC (stress-responsive transcriptional regulator)
MNRRCVVTCSRCRREIEADSVYCRFCGVAAGGPPTQRLTRVRDAGRIAGVCAGIAAYFDTDVTVVRLLWVVLSVVPGAIIGGVIAYAAAWLLMPAGESAVSAPIPSKRLVRPIAGRRIAGVCAGIALFIGVDATVVRLLWVILSIYPGAIICGVVFYLLAWAIVPSEPPPRLEPISSHI